MLHVVSSSSSLLDLLEPPSPASGALVDLQMVGHPLGSPPGLREKITELDSRAPETMDRSVELITEQNQLSPGRVVTAWHGNMTNVHDSHQKHVHLPAQ